MRVESSSDKSREREAWRRRAARLGPLSGGSLSSFLPPRLGEGAGAMAANFLAMVAIGLAAFFGRGGGVTETRALGAGLVADGGRVFGAAGLLARLTGVTGLETVEGRQRGAAAPFEIRAGPDGRFFAGGGGGGVAASSSGDRRTMGTFGLVIRRLALGGGGGGLAADRVFAVAGMMNGGRLVGAGGGAGGGAGARNASAASRIKIASS